MFVQRRDHTYNQVRMTKRKRTSHIPQGAPRKRRPVRRAFDSSTTERTDLEGNPIFADEIVNPAAAAFQGFQGPVETRPHHIATSGPARTRGRRVEQLRRSGGSSAEFAAAHISSAPLPVYERSFMLSELRRIGIISFGLLGVIIALTFILR
jgi:hypothetical protein